MSSSTAEINFSSPLAYAENYPRPKFLPLPHKPGSREESTRPLPKGVKSRLTTTRGRYSFALIALAELQPGDTVLFPAYHCPALVEPFIWAGCKIEFYNMNADLSPCEKGLDDLLKKSKAAVFVRHFGLKAKAEEFSNLARSFNCLVIEDLAHTAFPTKIYGDYSVTSLSKFYPVKLGSDIYISSSRDSDLIERVLHKYRYNPILWHLASSLRRVSSRFSGKESAHNNAETQYRYFNEFHLHEPLPHQVNKELLKHSSQEIAKARRSNYQTICRALEPSGLGRALYPELDSDTVPFAFPFLLDDSSGFELFRNAGIPLYRWEELAPTECAISKIYRSRLIQIPCHQDLTSDDICVISSIGENSRPQTHPR